MLMEPLTNMESNRGVPPKSHLNPPSPSGPMAKVSNGTEDHTCLEVYVNSKMEIEQGFPSNPGTVVRRSARATAGQHSNPFHLPRNVRGNVGQTNSIKGRRITPAPLLVTFRPWI